MTFWVVLVYLTLVPDVKVDEEIFLSRPEAVQSFKRRSTYRYPIVKELWVVNCEELLCYTKLQDRRKFK